jgi:hypothetical protein
MVPQHNCSSLFSVNLLILSPSEACSVKDGIQVQLDPYTPYLKLLYIFSFPNTMTTAHSLPLTLMRSGSSMIAAGICVGFLVPLTKYPRLGVSPHIHFLMEGVMVLSAGVLLYIAPLPHQAHKVTRCLADTLSSWQVKLIYEFVLGVCLVLAITISRSFQWLVGNKTDLTNCCRRCECEGKGDVVARIHYDFYTLCLCVTSGSCGKYRPGYGSTLCFLLMKFVHSGQ